MSTRVAPVQWRRLHAGFTWAEKHVIAGMVGYQPHAGQLAIHQSRARFRVVCCGRRFGKTFLSAFEAVCVAMMGGYATIAAPTYDLADICWSEAVNMVLGSRVSPYVVDIRRSRGDQLISFATGGIIDARTSRNPQSLIGRGRDLIIFDEAAAEPSPLAWQQSARPSLSDHEGAALFPSTPEGDNWFKELYDNGGVRDGWESWQMPSTARPSFPVAEFEEARAELPHTIFAAQYLAEFQDSVGMVFPGYRAISTAEWQEAPIPGHRYVIGVDIASVEDFTVIAIWDVTANCLAHLIRFNLIEYPEIETAIVEASRRWAAPVMIDATNNTSCWQHCERRITWTAVEPFVFSVATKPALYNQLAIAIQNRAVRLLADVKDHPVTRVAYFEMGAFRMEKQPSGRIIMSAPEGKHDDCCAAIAMAYEMAIRGMGGMPIIVPNSDDPPPSIKGSYAPKSTAIVAKAKGRPKLRR